MYRNLEHLQAPNKNQLKKPDANYLQTMRKNTINNLLPKTREYDNKQS